MLTIASTFRGRKSVNGSSRTEAGMQGWDQRGKEDGEFLDTTRVEGEGRLREGNRRDGKGGGKGVVLAIVAFSKRVC